VLQSLALRVCNTHNTQCRSLFSPLLNFCHTTLKHKQAWINSLVDMEEDEDMEMAFDMDDAE
jgi:hypothetical protein